MGFIVNYRDVVGSPTKIFSPDPESFAVIDDSEVELIYHIQIDLMNTGYYPLAHAGVKEKYEFMKNENRAIGSFSLKVNRKNLLNELLDNDEREIVAEKIIAYVLKGKEDVKKFAEAEQSYTNVPCFDINFKNILLSEKQMSGEDIEEEDQTEENKEEMSEKTVEMKENEDTTENATESVETDENKESNPEEDDGETAEEEEKIEDKETESPEMEEPEKNEDQPNDIKEEDTNEKNKEDQTKVDKKKNQKPDFYIDAKLIEQSFETIKTYFGIREEIKLLKQLNNQSMQPLDVLFPELRKTEEEMMFADKTVLEKSNKVSKKHNVKVIYYDKSDPSLSEKHPKSEILSVWLREQVENSLH